ncbi:V/A-type H+-transporting ATPase subunit I [Hathewaya proteolytica DSM 3090]|uniref:V/A-type H+-transporting ATPase subunit I n=1 Tax=Hathewaya proteolytica DSM 3090 TaxID=1121331 RepID=A0A1M6LG16_9CLOT|nr:V-type ATP synthase subunit I [Hathewaya proteolytica]SHJ70015.1 V/A-type H+-transporting ATPase subunit I [Hathewaya proteolytica DSM 3090]
MAIIKMSKFSLLSFKNDKSALLDVLQKFEKVQFINLQEKEDDDLEFFAKDSDKINSAEIEEAISKLNFSLNFINKYSPKGGGLKSLKEGLKTISFSEFEKIGSTTPWQEYYQSLKAKETELSSIKNEITKLKSDIEILSPWKKLDVSFAELNSLVKAKAFTGFIPKVMKEGFVEEFTNNFNGAYIEFIGEVKTDVNLVAIVHGADASECEKMLKKYGFSSFTTVSDEIPTVSIEEKNERITKLNEKEKAIVKEIESYADKRENLEVVSQYYDALMEKSKASDNFLKSSNILAVEGWVPTELTEKLEEKIKIACSNNYYLSFEEADKEDPEVPVELRNNKLATAFESITKMYSLPKYGETDPTSGLMFFYLVFFGMMMGDVGYGLLLFVGAGIALAVFNMKEDTKNFMRFFMALGVPTMIVGFIYGGFFGDFMKTQFPNVALFKGIVDPGTDVIKILLVSVVFGLVHILFGLGVKAYNYIKNKQYMDIVYDVVSMYLILLGATGLLAATAVSGIPPMVKTISMWAMILGMVIIVLTGGREFSNLGARIGQGLYSLYGLTGYVGDLISYSRLMAIGLAGGFVANAFNLMITLIPAGIARWIGGIIIFVVGHLFNLFISALGAYVHTCRLQYVEYFGKFYEGGGKQYTPFKCENKYINVKND